MTAVDATLYLLAFVGHFALCVAVVNRVHGTGMPLWVIKILTLATAIWYLGVLVWVAVFTACEGTDLVARRSGAAWPAGLIGYGATCVWAALVPVPWKLVGRWLRGRPPAMRYYGVAPYDLGRELGSGIELRGLGKLARLPGNEALRLEVTEKHLTVPNWPAELDGLTILHLSDLHYTNCIGRAFFERALELVTNQTYDLIAITGDVVENEGCLEWLQPTLGRLTARHGVYFLLGNHDCNLDERAVRRQLSALGLVDLGGSTRTLEIAGRAVVVAGNELPWIAPAADLRDNRAAWAHETSNVPRAPRILLSHCPDQLGWALANEFDLVLAGHTHGGQIVFPVLGPIVCPSRYGTRYASGTFQTGETVMHVSRGLSSDVPVRWNCPPEITRLTIRSACPAATITKPTY